MKKIIVAGAGGFVGSSLVKRLLKEDVQIWAVDTYFQKDALPVSEKLKILPVKSNNAEMIEMFHDGSFDSFYNLAWQGVNGPDKAKYDVQINNIMLTLRYAELAKSLGCSKYLCAGTVAECAMDSLSGLQTTSGGMMYSAAKVSSHLILETYCKNTGMDFVWMQFSNIYGPENKTGNLISYTIEQIKQGKPAVFGPAAQLYDFIYVDDLIEAICRLGIVKTEGNHYFIGSGTPRVLKDYLTKVGELCGRLDLIRIGERPDDGIKYTYDMMDNTRTVEAIGNYVSDSFENHIKYTIDHY